MTDEVQDTRSMWGDMFGGLVPSEGGGGLFGGLGQLFKIASDPRLTVMASKLMENMIESAQAAIRTEAKLDILLELSGHNVDDINQRVARAVDDAITRRLGGLAVILEQSGSAANGGPAVAAGTDNDGSGAAARPRRRTRGR